MTDPLRMARKPIFCVSPLPVVSLVRLAIFTAEPVPTFSHVSVVLSDPHVILAPPVVVLVEESLAAQRASLVTFAVGIALLNASGVPGVDGVRARMRLPALYPFKWPVPVRVPAEPVPVATSQESVYPAASLVVMVQVVAFVAQYPYVPQVLKLESPVRLMVPKLTGDVQELLRPDATARLTTTEELDDAAKDLVASMQAASRPYNQMLADMPTVRTRTFL